MTHEVVLLGWPVGHSLSPVMQEAAFASLGLDWRYSALAVRPHHLERVLADLAASPAVIGANVTLPHKIKVLQHVPPGRPAIAAAGAANTLVRDRGAGFVAHNTDVEGFLGCLAAAGFNPGGARCVVLGAGGAARACAVGLAAAGAAEVTVVGRSLSRARQLVEGLKPGMEGPAGACHLLARDWSGLDAALAGDDPGPPSSPCNDGRMLLINATPVGMWPGVSGSPLSPFQVETLPPGTQVVDLVYRPRMTRLLALAGDAGLPAAGGQEMLVRQGAASLSLWLGEPVAERVVEAMRRALQQALKREEAAAC
ncbi:MAG: shikimate dehydrogenase [Bacillota bacterium]|nr:shikimate dehydrogenase [Bacillota bacterium]